MARARLPTVLAARVRQLKKPTESIWSWSESRPGEVHVLLGPPPRRDPADAFWGASGRSFLFRKVSGRWVLVGQGCWRT